MPRLRTFFAALTLPILLLTLSGCGGGGGTSSTGSGGLTASAIPASLNVYVTDGFSDQYKQVLVTLYKIELTTDGTTYQTVYSDAAGQTINLSSLASTTDLLATVNVPAGAYTSARITFGDHFTLVAQDGTSTSVAVDPTVGTAANGTVALTVATPTKCVSGQASALFLDFKLAEFTLVGNLLRPQVGPGDPAQNGPKPCSGHLMGTVANLVAGTSFDLQGMNGRTVKVLLSATTATVSGQTGAAITLANGQSVLVDGAFSAATQTVTATTVTLNDYTSTQHERANGTVAGVNAGAGSFVLTVQRADGIQPTAGTITVQTASTTVFRKGRNQAGSLADVTTGAAVDVQGSFDATTQTLTARAVSLH